MPQDLPFIPVGAKITVDDGSITTFFRLLWEQLRGQSKNAGTVAQLPLIGKSDTVPTASLLVALGAGLYRVSWYLRETVNDGVSSSLTVTIGFSDKGQALTFVGPALTTDTITSWQTGSVVVRSDANVDLTAAIAYASNTPHRMTFDAIFSVEYLP